jgi:hypothetical protein
MIPKFSENQYSKNPSNQERAYLLKKYMKKDEF